MEWLLAVELVFVALSLSGSGWDDIPVSSHHVPPSHIYKLMEWFYLYILTQVMLTAYKLLDPRSPRAVHSGCREYNAKRIGISIGIGISIFISICICIGISIGIIIGNRYWN